MGEDTAKQLNEIFDQVLATQAVVGLLLRLSYRDHRAEIDGFRTELDGLILALKKTGADEHRLLAALSAQAQMFERVLGPEPPQKP
jgi:hypothetical protein